MDGLSFSLLKLMKEDFGDLGPFFLSRELKGLGFRDVASLTRRQLLSLVDVLVENVFSKTMSPQKRAIKKSKLLSLVDGFERSKEVLNNEKTACFLIRGKNFGVPEKEVISSLKQEAARNDLAVDHVVKVHRGFYVIVASGVVIVLLLIYFNSLSFDVDLGNNSTLNVSPLDLDMNYSGNVSCVDCVSGNASGLPDAVSGLENVSDFDNDSSDFSDIGTGAFPDSGDFGDAEMPDVGGADGLPNETTVDLDGLENESANSISDVVGNISDGSFPDVNVSVDNASLPFFNQSNVTAFCGESNKGEIFFDDSDGHFYGCDGFVWKQLDN